MAKAKMPLRAIEEIVHAAWEDEVGGYFRDDCDPDHCFRQNIAAAEWLSTLPGTAYDWAGMLTDLRKEILEFRAKKNAA